MKLTPDILEGFSRSILASRFDAPKPTPDFHRELWRFAAAPHQYVALAAPRGSAKSTAVTHTYGLAAALFEQSPFTVIVGASEDKASEFLQDMVIELKENEDLQAYFPIRKIEKATQTELIVRMQSGFVFRIIAVGIDAFKRGLKWRNMRPYLILLDDIEDDEAVLNIDRRDKLSKKINGAIIPSLSDNGILRMVGTVMHMDSYLENRMPNPKDPDTVVTELSETHLVDGELWASAKFKAHNEDFSKLLWPEKLNEQRLRMLRKQYEERGQLEVYSQEYLNYPIDTTTAFFREDDMLEIVEEDMKMIQNGYKRLRYYSAADFAISQKQRADFTVIVTVGVDEAGYLYVVDVRRGRWDAKQIADEMFSVQERYQPEIFTVEAGQIEKSLAPFLKAEMGTTARNGVYLNLNPMIPSADKQTRARSLQARMRAGKVRFNKKADWWDDLVPEMVQFPKSVHDDQVDALSWIGLTLDKLIEAETEDEWADIEYEQEFGDYMYADSRSGWTGY
jgi:predicted phage terminase large subunit-like protein